VIERYSRSPMKIIWTEESKLQNWLQIEVLACEAMSELGMVPRSAVDEIKQKARFDVERVKEIEDRTHHDVVAFLENLAENIGDASRYLHFGMTSSDVLDTALALQINRAHRVLLADLEQLLDTIRGQALKYKDTVCIGRSHGVHAEPTTFGLKLAVSYAQFKRDHERMSATAEGLRVGKISGAVGAYTTLTPEIEELTCAKLGLKPAPISTQILQRDRHAAYLAALAILGADLERLALEIRHLQRTEVAEAFEPFTKGQKGSSAMPHKRNPIVTERVAGLARLLRSNTHAAIENVALWHERDISHSCVERIIIPDGFHLAVYMLRKMIFVVRGLVVDEKRMAENLALTGGLTASSGLLVELIRAGLERKAAYELVQRHALAAWEGKGDFRTAIEKDPVVARHLDRKAIGRCFGQKPRFIDVTYRRLGIIGD